MALITKYKFFSEFISQNLSYTKPKRAIEYQIQLTIFQISEKITTSLKKTFYKQQMFNKSIFSTSINDLMQRNKFFQCFVCLQQFNSSKNFPMQICERQHFMCFECVQSKMFKRNFIGNGYVCNLCSCNIDTKIIKKSPFLLSIKDFVEQLIQREKIRKEKYKECITKQSEFAQELMNQNIEKTQKIQQLEKQVKQQQQLLHKLLENSLQPKSNITKNEQLPNNVMPKFLLTSKIGLQKEKPKPIKQRVPHAFQSMFKEIQIMKAQIENTECMDKEQLNQKLEELQIHQNYLYGIIQKSEAEESNYRQKKNKGNECCDFQNDGDYPDLF